MRYDDTELARFAMPRHNALSGSELRDELSMSEIGIRRRRQRGTLHRVGPDAYVFGSGALSYFGRARIGSILGGYGAGVHMYAALAMRGILSFEPSCIDVLTVGRPQPHSGYHFRRTSIHQPALAVVNHVPCVTVERAVRGLAAVLRVDRLNKVMHNVKFHRLLDIVELQRVTDLLAHTRGHATMVAALDEFTAGNNGSWGDNEALARSVLWEAVDDEHPIQNQHRFIDGVHMYVDFRWQDSGVSVEIDDSTHLELDTRLNDAVKERLLRSDGDVVLRVLTRDMRTQPDVVRADVRRVILAHREARAARRQCS